MISPRDTNCHIWYIIICLSTYEPLESVPHMTMFRGQIHPQNFCKDHIMRCCWPKKWGVFDHKTWSCGVSFPTNIMGLSMFTRVLDLPEAQGRRSNFFQKTLLFQFHWNLFWHPMMLQNIGVYVISPDEFIFYKVASEWLCVANMMHCEDEMMYCAADTVHCAISDALVADTMHYDANMIYFANYTLFGWLDILCGWHDALLGWYVELCSCQDKL